MFHCLISYEEAVMLMIVVMFNHTNNYNYMTYTYCTCRLYIAMFPLIFSAMCKQHSAWAAHYDAWVSGSRRHTSVLKVYFYYKKIKMCLSVLTRPSHTTASQRLTIQRPAARRPPLTVPLDEQLARSIRLSQSWCLILSNCINRNLCQRYQDNGGGSVV